MQVRRTPLNRNPVKMIAATAAIALFAAACGGGDDAAGAEGEADELNALV